MSMISFLNIMLIACFLADLNEGSALGPTRSPTQEIRIETDFKGRALTWRLTNLGSNPISRVAIPVVYIHDPHAPKRWTARNTGTTFIASANDPFEALRQGQTALMSATAASSGNKPGLVTAEVTFRNGITTQIEGVVSFQPEDGLTLVTIPVTLSLIALATLLRRRRISASCSAA